MKITIIAALICLLAFSNATNTCATTCLWVGYSCEAVSKMCMSCSCECLGGGGVSCEDPELCDSAKGSCRTLYLLGCCCCCGCLACIGGCIFAIVKMTGGNKGPNPMPNPTIPV